VGERGRERIPAVPGEDKIAVAGDSSGATLAAAVSLMARDRMGFTPRFQMLIYPATDRRMQSSSMQRYTDTPMWNSELNRLMWMGYLPNPAIGEIAYASPAEATDLSHLPTAYVETAEFDCLRDEGIAYARALKAAGVPTALCNTKGTMHGYDIVRTARTSRIAIARRIKFMREHFTL
jgi:acetyl esterase/lipase